MEPLRPLCGQLNLRDLTGIGVCVTMHWIDRYRTPSRSHCIPKGAGNRFSIPLPSARTARLFSFRGENGADLSVPRGVYHRKCYQSYTHKRELDKLAARLAEETATCRRTMSRTMTTVSNCLILSIATMIVLRVRRFPVRGPFCRLCT